MRRLFIYLVKINLKVGEETVVVVVWLARANKQLICVRELCLSVGHKNRPVHTQQHRDSSELGKH